jgi:hypothetical protein
VLLSLSPVARRGASLRRRSTVAETLVVATAACAGGTLVVARGVPPVGACAALVPGGRTPVVSVTPARRAISGSLAGPDVPAAAGSEALVTASLTVPVAAGLTALVTTSLSALVTTSLSALVTAGLAAPGTAPAGSGASAPATGSGASAATAWATRVASS